MPKRVCNIKISLRMVSEHSTYDWATISKYLETFWKKYKKIWDLDLFWGVGGILQNLYPQFQGSASTLADGSSFSYGYCAENDGERMHKHMC